MTPRVETLLLKQPRSRVILLQLPCYSVTVLQKTSVRFLDWPRGGGVGGVSGGVWDGFPDNCCFPLPPLRAKLCNRLWLTAVKALRILYPETDSSKSASTAWKPECSPRGPWAQYLEPGPGPGPGSAPSTQLRTW